MDHNQKKNNISRSRLIENQLLELAIRDFQITTINILEFMRTIMVRMNDKNTLSRAREMAQKSQELAAL